MCTEGKKVISILVAISLLLSLATQVTVIVGQLKDSKRKTKIEARQCCFWQYIFVNKVTQIEAEIPVGKRKRTRRLKIQHRTESLPDGVFNKFIRRVWKNYNEHSKWGVADSPGEQKQHGTFCVLQLVRLSLEFTTVKRPTKLHSVYDKIGFCSIIRKPRQAN